MQKEKKIEVLTMCSPVDGVRLKGFPTGMKLPVKRQSCEIFCLLSPLWVITHFIFENMMIVGYVSQNPERKKKSSGFFSVPTKHPQSGTVGGFI